MALSYQEERLLRYITPLEVIFGSVLDLLDYL